MPDGSVTTRSIAHCTAGFSAGSGRLSRFTLRRCRWHSSTSGWPGPASWCFRQCSSCRSFERRTSQSRLLPNKQHQQEDDDYQCGRSKRSAEVQAALGDRLVEEVADCCSERASEDERGPEQGDVAELRAEVEDRQDRQRGSEQQRSAAIA